MDPFFGCNISEPFDSLLDRHFPAFDKDVNGVASTHVDWVETPEAHVFKADIPGMKKEEIKVQIADDGVLSMCGESNEEKVDEKDTYRRTERALVKILPTVQATSKCKSSRDLCESGEWGFNRHCPED